MGAQPEVSMATMEVTGVGKRHPPQNFCDAKIITASWQLRGRGRACCSTGVLGGPHPGTRGRRGASPSAMGICGAAGQRGPATRTPSRARVADPAPRAGGRTRHARSRAPAGRTQLPRRRAPRLRVFASLSSGCQCSDPPPWKMRLLSAPGCGSHKGRFTKTALSPGYHPGSTQPAGRLTDQVQVAE